MTRLLPASLRGAVVLAATASLAGCMYLTPATGVCITQGCKDFETQRAEQAKAQAAAAAQPQDQPNVYDLAKDFQLITISAWSAAINPDGTPRVDASDPTGQLTFRVAFGRRIQTETGLETSEGISVITFNSGFTDKDDENQALLADAMRQSMGSLFSATPQADEKEAPLGGKPGRLVTMVGPMANPAATAPGAPSAAPSAAPALPLYRAIGRSAMHRGRGYVVVVRTLDSLYQQAAKGYDGLFEGFTFKDADPVYPPRPSALPSAAASGAPSAAPSGGPSAAPSALPSGAPSAAASAAPSSAPAGTPLPSPAS